MDVPQLPYRTTAFTLYRSVRWSLGLTRDHQVGASSIRYARRGQRAPFEDAFSPNDGRRLRPRPLHWPAPPDEPHLWHAETGFASRRSCRRPASGHRLGRRAGAAGRGVRTRDRAGTKSCMAPDDLQALPLRVDDTVYISGYDPI